MQLIAGCGQKSCRVWLLLSLALLFFMLWGSPAVADAYTGDDSDTIPMDMEIVNNQGEVLNPEDIINGTPDDEANDADTDADTDADPDADADADESDAADGELPELADRLRVGLYNAESGTTHPGEVVPVHLAFDGVYTSSDVPPLALSGRTLVPVRLISEQMAARVDWDKSTQTVTITMGEEDDPDKVIVLTIGSAVALIDGVEAAVPDEVSVSLVTYEGVSRTMVPVRFVSENLGAMVNYDQELRLVDILLPEPPAEPEPDGDGADADGEDIELPPPGLDDDGNMLRRVVIDAGHGGSDPGTNGGGYEEKTVTLAVSLLVQDRLEDAGYEVVMSRTEDEYPELLERAALTVDYDAPVFVSIHCNAAENIPGANGIETYAAPGDADDAELAGCIQTALITATEARDRGVKTSSLVVLTKNAAPACLVEIGFMTNEAECARIVSEDYQEVLAEAICAGIEEYFALREQ
ncbi:MAG: N-acetylmuramoyl-L-alanine amidase [Firmicutes bacterium]|nr:N-acetylmuramoyl-L-alanine amidase [Bacillota bacterium]